MSSPNRLLFVVNVDWFFLSHRLPIALEAIRQGFEVHIATSLTNRRATLEDLGLVVHSLDLDRSSAGPLGAWRTFLQIYRVFKSTQPTVAHLVTIKPVLLGGLAARLARVPALVAAVSGLGYVFLAKGLKASVQRLLIEKLYRAALAHSNMKVIFQNPDDLKTISHIAQLPKGSATLIRGSGVDLTQYTVAPFPPGPPVVLLAARLLTDKGVREFVEAARILRKSESVCVKSLRFVLVGSIDPENPASLTEQELTTWSNANLVELWGYRADMHEVLSAASVVVLPSYREGLPKVLIEAAACGRAVVTTDVPGCRDAIEAGVTGLLVPVRDASALAQAIQELVDDPARCSLMGRAGRELAEREFDVRKVVEAHMRIYDDLVEHAR